MAIPGRLEKRWTGPSIGTPKEAETTDHRFGLARILFLAERYEEALPLLEKLSFLCPDKLEYRGYLGVIAAKRGDRDEAIQILRRRKSTEQPYSAVSGRGVTHIR